MYLSSCLMLFSTGHGARDIMHDKGKNKYANVTKESSSTLHKPLRRLSITKKQS